MARTRATADAAISVKRISLGYLPAVGLNQTADWKDTERRRWSGFDSMRRRLQVKISAGSWIFYSGTGHAGEVVIYYGYCKLRARICHPTMWTLSKRNWPNPPMPRCRPTTPKPPKAQPIQRAKQQETSEPSLAQIWRPLSIAIIITVGFQKVVFIVAFHWPPNGVLRTPASLQT